MIRKLLIATVIFRRRPAADHRAATAPEARGWTGRDSTGANIADGMDRGNSETATESVR